MKNLKSLNLILISSLFLLVSCQDSYVPKPTGYFRINLDEKVYETYNANCGYSFETPAYSTIERNYSKNIDSCWLNIAYPEYQAKLHITYLPVENQLNSYLEDSYQLAYKHESKASGIQTTRLDRPEQHLGGLLYDIHGDVASSLQFFATDSTRHFLRGSLYFNHSPNEDSIAPVLSFIREDVVHLINTLNWDE